MDKLFEIRDLQTHFHTESGVVRALNGVNLSVESGERVGLVGETGSGKSVTARSALRLIKEPPGDIVSGSVTFRGEDILEYSKNELRDLRGSDIAMIFQDPSMSMNPVYTVRNQMVEVIRENRDVSKEEAAEIAKNFLEAVDMPRPEGVLDSYPHELSGGMQQRVMIAMELACQPDLIIADEPTSALDVTIQKKTLTIFEELVEDRDLAVIWITHNIGLVAQFCSRVAVMYAGEIVEIGETERIFSDPQHPYTRELLKTVPNMADPSDELGMIEGSVPNLIDPPDGCRFHPRCPDAVEACKRLEPYPVAATREDDVACIVHDPTDHRLETNESPREDETR